ncbi:MAG: FAD-dependent oxidoreductase [Sphingomonas sanxanigenens]|uniref:FAD-dependent oxidoreductase n=1 Tax=Sphingomonas sanxanigenens TaxID=397260 RepID=A0A2W5A2Z6_9SPHN|nr:MAG: FAD-dependent oxidoreductase [Sphingomonas sanxanigenens]
MCARAFSTGKLGDGVVKARIVVIGSGIAGASIAAAVAPYADVTLLESENAAGYHTTGRSAAMYLPSYGNDVVRALTRASASFLHSPPPEAEGHDLLRRRGLLTVADAAHEAALDAPAYSGHRWLSAEMAAMLVPALRRELIVGARYDPEAADIDVDLLHQSYLRMARTRGARILFDCRVIGAERVADLWRIACSDGSGIEAEWVVNAAGAWGDQVAGLFGAHPVGLKPLRRTMLLVDPPEGMATAEWPFVMTVQESLYFRPEAGKLLISPADETEDAPSDAQPEELDVAIGIDRFETLVDIPVRRISHSWAGLRTFAPDRAPVIGADPVSPGFFWFVGQGGYGIQMAPAAAALGAALLFDLPIPGHLVAEGVEARAVGPARFHAQAVL